uniref:Integrin beta N-terminal domain-containing protein n=1 Tax=Varanus komodoensis TaxID=61221 RepID=A0A8D2LCC9_VARKO
MKYLTTVARPLRLPGLLIRKNVTKTRGRKQKRLTRFKSFSSPNSLNLLLFIQIQLLSVFSWSLECTKYNVNTCNACIQSGPGCAWCKKRVNIHNFAWLMCL